MKSWRYLVGVGLLLSGALLIWGTSPPPVPISTSAPAATPLPGRTDLARAAARSAYLRERYPSILAQSTWSDLKTRPIFEKLQTARQTGNFNAVNQAALDLAPLLASGSASDTALLLSARVQWNYHLFEEGLDTLARVKRHEGATYLDLAFDLNMELGHYSDAEAALGTRLDQFPDVGAYLRLGWWRGLHGDIPGQIEAYTWAMGTADSRDLALMEWLGIHRAVAYVARGDLAAARADLKEVVARGAISPALHYAQGALALASEDLATAEWNYIRGTQIQPQVEMLGVLSRVYSRLGQEKQARGQLELAELVDKNTPGGGPSVELASVWQMAGIKKDEVLSISREGFSRRKDVGTCVTFAVALIDAGRLFEAEGVLQSLRAYGIGGSRVHYAEARLASAKRDWITVERTVDLIHKTDPAFYVLNLPALQSLGATGLPPAGGH